MAYFEHPDYVPLLRRAYDGWAALERACGRRLITWTGALMIGRPDVGGRGRHAGQRHVGGSCPTTCSMRAAMAEPFGQFRLGDDEVAVYERDAGVVHPEAAVRALHEQAPADGAELRFESPIDGWDLGGDGVTVERRRRAHRGRHLVVTAGPWAAKLLGTGFPLTPCAPSRYHYRPGGRPRGVRPRPLPRLRLGARRRRRAVRTRRRRHRGTEVRLPPPPPPDRSGSPRPRGRRREELAAMRAVLAERIPALPAGCVATTVCMYTMTPDEHFVIGHLPGSDGGVSVAAGFSGHGFKFVPVVGEILADLAIDGGTDARSPCSTPPASHAPKRSRRRGSRPRSAIDCSRITNFCTLPVTVIGNSSTKRM